MNINNNNNTYSFTARCPQIRDAEWVCRVINNKLPHTSSSKHQPRILNFIKTNKDFFEYQNEPQELCDAYLILLKSYKHGKPSELSHKIEVLYKFLDKFSRLRMLADSATQNNLESSLYCFEKLKIGNCFEDATVAELILKMNGIKNAVCTHIYKSSKMENAPYFWTQLDHVICAFNKDGSPFNGKISKNTIFIDPWANKVGFAKDMERYYQHELNSFFHLDKNEEFKYLTEENINLNNNEIKYFTEQYKHFIFKSKKRTFMHKN